MSIFLIYAYLFFIGSILGWVAELLFRRFISSANPERKWINPGFCVGPYIPLYGFGLCCLFAMTYLETEILPDTIWGKIVMIIMMAVAMTALEFIAGLFVLKISNVRLWDYTKQWGNIMGLICPKFSLIWAACGAAYYIFVHPHIIAALYWLSENLAFSFFIGFFFGIFLIDVVYSSQLLVKIRKFAVENDVIVRYENLKSQIRKVQDETRKKVHFLLPFYTGKHISEHLKENLPLLEIKRSKNQKNIKEL